MSEKKVTNDPNFVQKQERLPGPLGSGRQSAGIAVKWRAQWTLNPRRSAPAPRRVAKSQQGCLGRDIRPGGELSEIRFGQGLEIRTGVHIGRARHRVQEAQEMASVEEGRERLTRWESASLEALQVAMPLVSQLQGQIRGPDHQDCTVQTTRIAPCMPIVKRPCRSGQGSGPVPVMPRYIPAELSTWMGERQADFHDAFADGDNARVLEITSKLSGNDAVNTSDQCQVRVARSSSRRSVSLTLVLQASDVAFIGVAKINGQRREVEFRIGHADPST